MHNTTLFSKWLCTLPASAEFLHLPLPTQPPSPHSSSPILPTHERKESRLPTIRSVICKVVMSSVNAGHMKDASDNVGTDILISSHEAEPREVLWVDGWARTWLIARKNTSKRDKTLAFLKKGDWATREPRTSLKLMCPYYKKYKSLLNVACLWCTRQYSVLHILYELTLNFSKK